ncbi:hypothetical protein [Methylorubrum extorquens]|nr:hypothetical protein [Methylorubrum extorquens]MCP1542783.1 hypothetical protein [Methylorubrum extorquens]MCP1589872.1 hypothetical protein [Methylorubrum extorquens]
MRGGVFGRLCRVVPLESLPAEGTVVDTRRGHAVVRGGALVSLSEAEAEDLVDPAGAAERRYRAAVVAAGWPDKLKRIVAPAGHDWQADGAYPTDDASLAHVYCAKTAGRHIWVRNVTYREAVALGVTA